LPAGRPKYCRNAYRYYTMSKPIEYSLGNPNSPKFNMFGYALIIAGIIMAGLGYYEIGVGILGVIAVGFGGVVVTSRDGVIIDMEKDKLKGYTTFYGYKYGEWENLRNYGSVSILISHRVWKVKHIAAKYADVTPREFLVCMLGKSHRKKQNLGRFDSQEKAQTFAKEVSEELNLPLERYQQGQLN